MTVVHIGIVLSKNYSPVVCTDVGVQTVENMPVVSQKASEELI